MATPPNGIGVKNAHTHTKKGLKSPKVRTHHGHVLALRTITRPRRLVVQSLGGISLTASAHGHRRPTAAPRSAQTRVRGACAGAGPASPSVPGVSDSSHSQTPLLFTF